MRPLPIAAALLFGLSALAWAKQPALHHITWYRAHDKEREVTLRMCRNNQSLQLASDDCSNAERAAATAQFRDNPGDELSFAETPDYFVANPWARMSVLNSCDHPERPGSQIFLRYCPAARAAAARAK